MDKYMDDKLARRKQLTCVELPSAEAMKQAEINNQAFVEMIRNYLKEIEQC